MSGGALPPREPWLTRKELAAALKVSTTTIYRLGIKPDLVVGNQGRYYLSSAEAQLQGKQRPSADVIPIRRGKP